MIRVQSLPFLSSLCLTGLLISWDTGLQACRPQDTQKSPLFGETVSPVPPASPGSRQGTGTASAKKRVQEIRFHGNHRTSDQALLELIELRSGDLVTPDVLRALQTRLEQSDRFERVEIRERYASLSPSNDVILVISVQEKIPVSKKFMLLPLLSYADEFGLTYGGRLTWEDLLGADERISFPLTWGGTRQAAAQVRIPLASTLVSYITGGGGIAQQKNPAFDRDHRRTWGQMGVEKRFRQMTLHLSAHQTDHLFAGRSESLFSLRAGAVVDTRENRVLPRDAFLAGFEWEAIPNLDGGAATNRYRIDVRGYADFVGRSVLAGQALFHLSDQTLPPYLKPFLGGAETLRGYSAGRFVGDNLAIGSLELRIPMHRPGSLYRTGFNLFFDTGTVYDSGNSISDARFRHGAGAGFWVLAFGLGFKIEAAHDLDRGLRAHFSAGFRF